VAVTLINPMEKPALDRIARQYEIELEERIIPSREDVAEIVAERLTALLEARLRKRDKLQTERSQRFEALARTLADEEDELPIITMMLDDYYQKMLHPTVERPRDQKKSAQKGRPKKRRDTRRRGSRRRR
jgi:ATP-dependent RNA helicase DeaD